jgi:hypothetical protein
MDSALVALVEHRMGFIGIAALNGQALLRNLMG